MLLDQDVANSFSTNHPISSRFGSSNDRNQCRHQPSHISLVLPSSQVTSAAQHYYAQEARRNSLESRISFPLDQVQSHIRTSKRQTRIKHALSDLQAVEEVSNGNPNSTRTKIGVEEATNGCYNSSKIQSQKTSIHTKYPHHRYLGNIPDVHWRALSLEHLRLHPLYDPLPASISVMKSLEDARLFRQESWQWEALHKGRCTTSQAAAALGLLEPEASMALNIPWIWRGSERRTLAFHRLSQDALQTLDEMNALLCNCSGQPELVLEECKPRIWMIPKSKNANGMRFPFAAKYLPKETAQERRRRKERAKGQFQKGIMHVRFMWGDSQEAVSVLTALNYFWKKEPALRVQEVGMCGTDLTINKTDESSSMLLGATPDAILRYPNGSIEALEVKNHCPFVTAQWATRNATARYAIRRMPFREPYVSPQYVPQLMMEMLCVGPECRSAVMVRQTAMNGAIILRVHRDDGWLEEMLFWLNKFQQDYVKSGTPPPENFFWNNDILGERYKKFVKWTAELGSTVDLLDHVKHNDIQRVMAAHGSHSSMFLD